VIGKRGRDDTIHGGRSIDIITIILKQLKMVKNNDATLTMKKSSSITHKMEMLLGWTQQTILIKK
jgi:hypothetical protein